MTEQEFSRLIGLYRETVFRVAYCYTKSYADSEDISQEVFLKLYTSEQHFEADANVKAWLITVTANRCKNLLKSRWYRLSEPLTEQADTPVFMEKEDFVLPILMTLKPKIRTVLYMYYYEEYSVKEICLLLGESKTAITTRLMRGRRQLKELLIKEGYDELQKNY